jgi:hypothetical protein
VTSHAPTSVRFRSAFDIPVQISGLEASNNPIPSVGSQRRRKKEKQMFVFVLTLDRPTIALPLPLAHRRPSSFPMNIAATTSGLLLTNALETAKLIIRRRRHRHRRLKSTPRCHLQHTRRASRSAPSTWAVKSGIYRSPFEFIFYFCNPSHTSSQYARRHLCRRPQRRWYLAASWDMAAPHCDFSFVVLDPSTYLPNLAG